MLALRKAVVENHPIHNMIQHPASRVDVTKLNGGPQSYDGKRQGNGTVSPSLQWLGILVGISTHKSCTAGFRLLVSVALFSSPLLHVKASGADSQQQSSDFDPMLYTHACMHLRPHMRTSQLFLQLPASPFPIIPFLSV